MKKGHVLKSVVLLLAACGVLALFITLPRAQAQGTFHIYLTLVRRLYPPIPGEPQLFPIDNVDGDGNYTVRWSTAVRAESYELEEQWGTQDWFVAYKGSATQAELHNRPAGQYTYRCRAQNSWGYGGWSNVQTVNVPGTPPGTLSTPSSSSYSAGGMAVVRVINDCPYVLRLDFTGPLPTLMELPRCDVCHVYSFIGPIFCPTEGRPLQSVQLTPGQYRVFVRVDNPSINPCIGVWDLKGDRRYTVCFYIVSRLATGDSSAVDLIVPRQCE